MNEFDIIKRYFSQGIKDSNVLLSIGDDAALVRADPEQALAICVDTLIESVHFPKTTKAEDIAYKAVAVNLSDLAAMGASPRWITLSLTLPAFDAAWLTGFSEGLTEICKEYKVALIGGDTTCGPLSVTVQAHGFVPLDKALKRHGAKTGDKIFVTKALGLAALGLQVMQGKIQIDNAEILINELNRPEPAVQQGLLLREYANSCIDISDGFLADLQHILEAGKVGAAIDLTKLPVADAILDQSLKLQAALTGGDDYGLCFTVAPEKVSNLLKAFSENNFPCYEVGEVTVDRSLLLLNQEQYNLDLGNSGFLHF
jgi:thiamine-monophosphate kinase